MEFYEVIRTRRSIRSYEPDEIQDEVLRRILDAARIAPSGSNRQPWKFIIVRDADAKARIATACGQQAFIADAPVVIVACGKNIEYNRGGYMGDFSMLVDVSIAMTQLILAAREEGLGTCWIGMFENEPLKQMLHVPRAWNVVAVTPVGYPTGQAFMETSERKSLEEIISYDRFD